MGKGMGFWYAYASWLRQCSGPLLGVFACEERFVKCVLHFEGRNRGIAYSSNVMVCAQEIYQVLIQLCLLGIEPRACAESAGRSSRKMR